MTIAIQKIRAYMAAHGILPIHLAAELGLNRSTLTRWLNGERQPTAQEQRRMNRRFGIVNEWVEKPARTGKEK